MAKKNKGRVYDFDYDSDFSQEDLNKIAQEYNGNPGGFMEVPEMADEVLDQSQKEVEQVIEVAKGVKNAIEEATKAVASITPAIEENLKEAKAFEVPEVDKLEMTGKDAANQLQEELNRAIQQEKNLFQNQDLNSMLDSMKQQNELLRQQNELLQQQLNGNPMVQMGNRLQAISNGIKETANKVTTTFKDFGKKVRNTIEKNWDKTKEGYNKVKENIAQHANTAIGDINLTMELHHQRNKLQWQDLAKTQAAVIDWVKGASEVTKEKKQLAKGMLGNVFRVIAGKDAKTEAEILNNEKYKNSLSQPGKLANSVIVALTPLVKMAEERAVKAEFKENIYTQKREKAFEKANISEINNEIKEAKMEIELTKEQQSKSNIINQNIPKSKFEDYTR